MSDVLRDRLESIVGNGLAVEIRTKREAALVRGLEAKRTKVLQHKGDIVLGPEQHDHESQLRAAEMAYKLDGAFPDRMEIGLDGSMKFTTDEELLGILASLGAAPTGGA